MNPLDDDHYNLVMGVVIEEATTINFTQLCQKYHISQELLVDMIDAGFFPHNSLEIDQFYADQKTLRRLESAFRLHHDLEINLPGVILALDLLDELERIRQELRILKKQL